MTAGTLEKFTEVKKGLEPSAGVQNRVHPWVVLLRSREFTLGRFSPVNFGQGILSTKKVANKYWT